VILRPLLVAALLAGPALAGDPPRIFYLCSDCDQYQMGYAEDLLSQAARARGVGVIKMGNTSEYSDYEEYRKNHPKAVGGLVPVRPVKLPYDISTFPKDEKEAAFRRKSFEEAKKVWASQLLDQLKRLDKTKPVVLHFGNHGFNLDGGKAEDASPFCMYGTVRSKSQCLTYREIGDLMEQAGLTGPKAPLVRILGDHCHGGGVHSLSQRFPNVCSASIVGFKDAQSSPETGLGSEAGLNRFGATFWRSAMLDGNGASLAGSYQAAWSLVPAGDSPGGTLSSVYYAQQIMKWDDKELPTHDRLPELSALEQNFPSLDALLVHNRIEGLRMRPEYAACPAPRSVDVAKTADLEAILNALRLEKPGNVYRQALEKAKNPSYFARGKAAVAAMNACWTEAGKKYDNADPDIQKFIDNNGNWDRKNWFRSGSAVRKENNDYAAKKIAELAGAVLDRLAACLKTNEPVARDYLNAVETLTTLERLQSFAKKATPAQKDAFRKKVECESSPLL
jgi:hypothetical protein